jgi:hypothetical protein
MFKQARLVGVLYLENRLMPEGLPPSTRAW